MTKTVLLTNISRCYIGLDGNVFMFCFVVAIHPVLDPPASVERSMLLYDKNNATCLILDETDMYVFSATTGRWAPEPQWKCFQDGLVIKMNVPEAIKMSFSVAITGRNIVCSQPHIEVLVRKTAWSQCEIDGRYLICQLGTATGPENGGLTSCVAKCTCDGEDCEHVYVQIPNVQEQWEICEIDIN